MNKAKISHIEIFDFDGTLCFTPTKPKDWKGGWWGNKVSLLPPHLDLSKCFLNDIVADAYMESALSDNHFTVMLTGRHTGLQKYVLDILKHYGLTPEVDHPRERAIFTDSFNTLEFKKQTIAKLLQEFPMVEVINMWEDREIHVIEFREMGKKLKLKEFQVFAPSHWHKKI